MATYYWRGGSGGLNTASTANLAAAATAATFTASRTLTVLTVTAVASGTITNGDTVWSGNSTNQGKITSFITGSGGTGTYGMDTSGSITSRTMSSATIGAGPITSTDDLVVDVDSNVGTATWTLTATATAFSCRNLTISGLDGAMTFTFSASPSITGNLSLPVSNFTMTGAATINFTATSAKTITTGGNSISCDVVFNGVAGSWQIQDAFTTARTSTLTNGTLDLNNLTYTTLTFVSSNTNTRVIAFGTGKIVLSGGNNLTIWNTATATNLSFTGTPNIEASSVGSTGTRTILAGSTAGENETYAPPFKILGGTDAVAMTGSALGNVDFTGFAGTFGNQIIKFYGDLTISSGMTLTGGANAWTFAKTTGVQLFTNAGATLDQPFTENGAGGTLRLGGNITITGATRSLGLTNGTLDLNGHTLTMGVAVTSTGTKNITWNGGTFVLTGSGATAFNNNAPTNFTTTAGTGAGVISMTSASAKTFVGGGSTFNAKLAQDGAGTLTITGSNTFTDISNSVQPTSVLFTAGTTNTFTTGFSLSGTSGNLVTLGSVTAATHTLSKASGVVSVNYVTISQSTATGGATWDAFTTNGNVDGGSNSGWIFTAPPTSGNFLVFF